MVQNALKLLVQKCDEGIAVGIPSYCTANDLVIEALLEQALRFNQPILLEATANQVNQFGGYTGMRPADYRDFIYEIADRVQFPQERIILGGDHLGPLTWADEPEAQAMQKARELVREFVLAGYKKIHLDTSMRLGDDDPRQPLADETIARRGVELYAECEAAYQALREKNPDEVRPVYVIGSEVPIPGGAVAPEDSISITEPSALENTLRVYRDVFEAAGFKHAFEDILAVVVQPGVEFGDDEVHRYDARNAERLCTTARAIHGIVLEGHSTDYQSPWDLRGMVEDGIAILKVGPALTYALREGLFALSMLEELLVPEEHRANLVETLEQAMLANPENWIKHYHGDSRQLWLKRKFSFSDRCRYYFARPEIRQAIARLFENMEAVEIPLSLLHQYLPMQYALVRDGLLEPTARNLVKDCVVAVADDYNYAVGNLRRPRI